MNASQPKEDERKINWIDHDNSWRIFHYTSSDMASLSLWAINLAIYGPSGRMVAEAEARYIHAFEHVAAMVQTIAEKNHHVNVYGNSLTCGACLMRRLVLSLTDEFVMTPNDISAATEMTIRNGSGGGVSWTTISDNLVPANKKHEWCIVYLSGEAPIPYALEAVIKYHVDAGARFRLVSCGDPSLMLVGMSSKPDSAVANLLVFPQSK